MDMKRKQSDIPDVDNSCRDFGGIQEELVLRRGYLLTWCV